MIRKNDIWLLLAADCIGINCAWIVFSLLRMSGIFTSFSDQSAVEISSFIVSGAVLYLFWSIAFVISGLYQNVFYRQLVDIVFTIIKVTVVGTIILALFVFWNPIGGVITAPLFIGSRLLIFLYFVVLSLFVIISRLIAQNIHDRILASGVGKKNSIILGGQIKAVELYHKLQQYPRLGYHILGYISPNALENTTTNDALPSMGTLDSLESIIKEKHITEVLIALDSSEHDLLLDVIGRTSRIDVGLKIIPDLYDIVSGQARVREIYGFPLIDINPQILQPWEETTKRMIDVLTSTMVIVIGLPLWVILALLVKITSKGPIIYSQERSGRNGNLFRIYKFRSMYTNAESGGPVWASRNDPRVTPIGKFLRKTHLDEVPQFWNVLKGDMSLVGPRPERPYFIEQLVKEIPYYTRRLRVRPGITGLYQAMVDKYDESIDDVKERVRYDLMYIESMSFRLDIKILFRTAYMMLKGKGHA